MHLKFRNVNDAFAGLVKLFREDEYTTTDGRATYSGITRKSPSRYGDVRMIEEPVLVTYSHPHERVLFNQGRDCNPFLHLYEFLWMLAGRNDVKPLAYYAKRMAEFSDDGETLNGAYGYRWRRHWTKDPRKITYGQSTDQLDLLVAHLREKPESRRAVLQMWNVEDDLLKIGGGVCPECGGTGTRDMTALVGYPTKEVCQHRSLAGSKDVCCNLSVMFSLRVIPTSVQGDYQISPHHALDMMVTNRSNDMIWGMLGADYVHFSFLQEYVAARLGCEVGVYNHFTNNLHVYDKTWEPEKWMADDTNVAYEWRSTKTVPLVRDPATFERELPEFVERYSGKTAVENLWVDYEEPFLQDVAQPMLYAFACHKERDYNGAYQGLNYIQADDWRLAVTNWIDKRRKNV